MDSTILRKSSVVQRVFHSHVFNHWFAEEVRAEKDSGVFHITNLRAAKHRFETFSTPLGRLILHLPAFLRTLRRIQLDRPHEAVGQAQGVFLGSSAESTATLTGRLSVACGA
jgi:hypothetical protein